jgi:hypothetical protein
MCDMLAGEHMQIVWPIFILFDGNVEIVKLHKEEDSTEDSTILHYFCNDEPYIPGATI